MHIYLEHKLCLRRFLSFESSSDGSLVFWVPRISADKAAKGVRYTVHTTGTVHKQFGGEKSGRIFIDPLFDLQEVRAIAHISVPNIERLDLAETNEMVSFVSVDPDKILSRLDFSVSIGPKSSPYSENCLRLDFEIYSVFVRLETIGAEVPDAFDEHFLYGLYPSKYDRAKISRDWAELLFWKQVHPNTPIVLRRGNGSYRLLAEVPMRVKPKLEIRFNRPDLRSEQIRQKQFDDLTHFVEFWICGKGGRIKDDDLRQHIVGWVLDAEF